LFKYFPLSSFVLTQNATYFAASTKNNHLLGVKTVEKFETNDFVNTQGLSCVLYSLSSVGAGFVKTQQVEVE